LGEEGLNNRQSPILHGEEKQDETGHGRWRDGSLDSRGCHRDLLLHIRTAVYLNSDFFEYDVVDHHILADNGPAGWLD
jgi:hypothetical protein